MREVTIRQIMEIGCSPSADGWRRGLDNRPVDAGRYLTLYLRHSNNSVEMVIDEWLDSDEWATERAGYGHVLAYQPITVPEEELQWRIGFFAEYSGGGCAVDRDGRVWRVMQEG